MGDFCELKINFSIPKLFFRRLKFPRFDKILLNYKIVEIIVIFSKNSEKSKNF